MSATIERPASDAMVASPPDQGGLTPETLATLESIERRLLWLSTQIIHHANNVRPNPDKSKVGGHQASSASVATDPHRALLLIPARRRSRLDQTARLPRLPRRAIPARPPRPLVPDHAARVRRSAGLSSRAPRIRIRSISRPARSGWARWRRSLPRWPPGTPRLRFGDVSSDRFVALIGDAELDEGNVWEAVAEEAIQGLGNVIWIIDLNRQSLDRVIPGVRAGAAEGALSPARAGRSSRPSTAPAWKRR